MLKKNKNRGAGLVTVVVVLAVSSILLSASIWLSFQHYKNVLISETKDEERAELDLFAELICMSMNSGLTLESVCSSDSALSSFYSLTEYTDIKDESEISVGKSITLDGYSVCLLPLDTNDLSKGAVIQYCRGSELILQKEYGFKLVDGKYQIAAPISDTTSDTIAEVTP